MKHILLHSATNLEQRLSILPLDKFQYDFISGFWVDNNGSLMIDHKDFGGIGTKKFDVETGEDKK